MPAFFNAILKSSLRRSTISSEKGDFSCLPSMMTLSAVLKEPPGRCFSAVRRPCRTMSWSFVAMSEVGNFLRDLGHLPGEQMPAPSTKSLWMPFLGTRSGGPAPQWPSPLLGRLRPLSSFSVSVVSSPLAPTLSQDRTSSSSDEFEGIGTSSPSLMQWSMPLESASAVAFARSCAEMTSLLPSQGVASSEVEVQGAQVVVFGVALGRLGVAVGCSLFPTLWGVPKCFTQSS